ncbi:toxin VasX [Capnocytophaga cynodegmi]|uniref:toxin VasX n=1 Tax=Capnocytophaga cynodegmi TaxID=28189 RepID=UPI003859B674
MNKTYIFTMEGAGASLKKSPELIIREKGVYLHFLRYGLFDRNSQEKKIETDYIPTIVKKILKVDENQKTETIEINEIKAVETIALKGVPSLENFHVARTVMNTGYIYLINDEPNKKDIFKELYVGEDGKLQYIIKEGKKNKKYSDLRTFPFDQEKLDYLIVKPNSRYWVAYSAVQWSYSYLLELISDQEKRKERMKLIICEGIKKDEEPPIHLNSIKDVSVCFHKDDSRFFIWERNLQHICADEKAQDKKGDNRVYEDMFITLDDPLGCAQDISEVLQIRHLKHKALIESIQIGENDDDIFKHLLKNIENLEENPFSSGNSEQVNAVFNTALVLYHFIYGEKNKEHRDKFEKHTDFDKIKTILALDLRKKHREYINSLRKDLVSLLSASYFTDYLDIFIHDSRNVFIGKYILSEFIALLAEHPHYKDRFIDLPEEYEGNNDDNIDGFIRYTTKNESVYYKIFSSKSPFEELEQHQDFLTASVGFKLSRAILKTAEKIVDAYAKHLATIGNSEVLLNYLKAFKYRGEVVFQVSKQEILTYEKSGFSLDKNKFVPNKKGEIGKEYVRIKTSMKLSDAYQKATTQRVQLPLSHKGEKLMREVLDHPRFRLLIASVELINLAINLKKISEKSEWKTGVSTIGASVQLINSVRAYGRAQRVAMGIIIDERKQVKMLRKLGNFLKISGAGIPVLISVWDCVDSFKLRDYDASVAWGASAVLSGIVFAEAMGWVSLSFWPLTIVVVLSFGVLFLAIYLTDSPLEKFIKNNILSKSNHFLSTYPATPFLYTKELVAQRNKLVDEEVAQWRDLIRAQEDLYDMLCSHWTTYELHGMATYGKKREETIAAYIREALAISAGTHSVTYKRLVLNVVPAKFSYDVSKFHFKLLFFPKGLQDNYTSETEPLFLESSSITLESYNSPILRIEYNIYDSVYSLLSISSLLIFISQTEIDAERNEYWPSQRKGERYQAVKISPTEFIGGNNTLAIKLGSKLAEDYLRSHIRIGTLTEIKKPKTWK